MMTSGPARFRELLAEETPVVLPGIYDAFTAALVESLGFSAVYLGGFASALQMGTLEPLMTLTEQVTSAETVTKAVSIPVLVDGHAGYGDPIHVTRTTMEYEWAGIAGMHIEDAVYPKRMHYFRDVFEKKTAKRIIDLDEMVAKITYAASARCNTDFLIFARTEARTAHEGGLDEVRRRLTAFLEAGADGLMPQTWDPEEAAAIGAEFGKEAPLVWIENPPNPQWPELSIEDVKELGYKVAIYPTVALGESARAILALYTTLRDEGRTNIDDVEQSQTWDVVNRVFNLERYYSIEEATTERAIE
jgi:2-methylisocitrate lyase-like PEP mutase family enzyme